MPQTTLKYTGATPGGDSNTYVLFASTQATSNAGWSALFAALSGNPKFRLNLKADKAGQLNAYVSADRGANWRQVYNEIVPALPSNMSLYREFDVGAAPDWKLEWVNGGSAQTFFIPSMYIVDDPTPVQILGPLTGTQTITKSNVGVLKAGPGIYYSATWLNTNAAAQVIALVDKASNPATGDTPVLYFDLATTQTFTLASKFGIRFNTGIAWAECTTHGASTITTTAGSDICVGLVECL